ncbi:MAG: queuosine salvage family protein [Actinomycetota bacterium]|nr:queuosine salvage family protein [Actinomycetota bacterium]MDQ3648422.1 queuosine salvage family protein [Actinomycetota bacterium]
MSLPRHVREHCAELADRARWVTIDLDRLGSVQSGPEPALDPKRHFLEGSREEVCAYLLTLDAINFGSGWFPTLRRRRGCSGYLTVAWALADRFRSAGPWSAPELRLLSAGDVADVLGQDPDHDLMALYGEALRDLGRFLGDREPADVVDGAGGSAVALAEELARGMPFFDDPGFYKRAQITPNDLSLAGVAELSDLDELTIFADNLVPHVLRVDGVLRYDPELGAHIDSGELLPPGEPEQEIRACALHACELMATELGVSPRTLDGWLWNRGQEPRYKTVPRHRTRTTFY